MPPPWVFNQAKAYAVTRMWRLRCPHELALKMAVIVGVSPQLQGQAARQAL